MLPLVATKRCVRKPETSVVYATAVVTGSDANPNPPPLSVRGTQPLQSATDTDPGRLHDPAGQAVHTDAPVPPKYVPPGHGRQVDDWLAPVFAEYVPAPQAVHVPPV